MTQRFSRRQFLRATLVSVVSAGLSACKGDGDGTTDSDGSTGTDGTEPTGSTAPTTGAEEPLLDGAAYFPQSVASGDPRPDSVILWTRVDDAAAGDGDLELTVELATDPEFTTRVELDAASATIPARVMFDRCAKAKVKGLEPATVYYYRFVHNREDGRYASQVGRTRTAPAPDADVAVRFAYASCQDYNGRYYNSYRGLLAQPDLDFFVHLGDYVYETTGDPTFQAAGRGIAFSDTAGAIVFNEGSESEYFAASSLSNYRELYRGYRSDPALRRVHESLPMIAVWDDHEFSDDCFGATATYFDGRVDERDEDRRKHANQAWFEYMPVDFGDDAFVYDPSKPHPQDITIYRDFRFGKHLHLVMTDLRSYRPDHLIPEDGFPGAVVLDEAALVEQLGSIPEFATPYVEDIDAYQGGIYKDALAAAADGLGFDPALVTGKIDAGFINSTLASVEDPTPPIDEAELATLPRGLSFLGLGKRSFNGSIGARYFVVKPAFDAWAAARAAAQPTSVDVMGQAQREWFLSTMKGSTATWKVWGTEITLMPLVIDLTAFPIEPFNQLYYMNVDQWDGFGPARDALLGELAAVDNVVAITGDIHAFYAGTPMVAGAPEQKIVELVGAGISSTPFQSLLVLQVAADPTLSSLPGAGMLASAIDALFTGTTTNPHLGFADSSRNGFVSVVVDGAELNATFHMLSEDVSLTDYEGMDDALAGKFKREKFQVKAGQRDLWRDFSGTFKRWDPTTNMWV
ncbi:alkaline phosphatase D [Nannocystis exedens]|uniref:Alkaline phosphatase D n=1 Tax=Nannocystis exedens TaxID=54 RepID=A0A1I1V3H4_9BACT|nr:alkaline phosphatase D family protein [Nannocystis exedens]PCC72313.1 Alkaline phosphatase D precursor [Nannocystis exedens]SFD77449.1 alkaline phosphatase D [Nannocystis exedens]